MWGDLNEPNHIGTYPAFGLAACLYLAHQYRRWLDCHVDAAAGDDADVRKHPVNPS